MEISLVPSNMGRINEYIELYKVCFSDAKHFDIEYFNWLYLENPCGKAIGIDAISNGRIVGHNILIPVEFLVEKKIMQGLVSMNTVVHPEFQGKGLFVKIGKEMIQYAKSLKYSFIIGVANANSTHGFIKHLGFQLVSPLAAKLGLGSIIPDCNSELSFIRNWSNLTLAWRLKNPKNPATILNKEVSGKAASILAKSNKLGINATATIFCDLDLKLINDVASIHYNKWLPRVFIGLMPTKKLIIPRYFDIPDFMKPSPLNFIYKNLIDESHQLNHESCFINFLDFDAF